MSVIRNSARAFIGALLVILAYHGVMASLGLATFSAHQMPLPSPDQAFQIFARRILIDGSMLFAGHRLLRSFGIATRLAYGLMGGAAMVVGYAFALSNGLMMWPPLPGAQVTAAVLPLLIGMIAGSIYAQFAGREFIARAFAGAAPAADAPPTAIFNGPERVRSSISATMIAAIVPAAVFAVVVVPLFSSAMDLGSLITRFNWSEVVTMIAAPSYLTVIVLMVTAIPAAIIVQVTHAIARSMNRMRGIDYAVIGAIISSAVALAAAGYITPLLLLPAMAIVGALMGAIYRRFAGLEPLPLPEAVLATDPAHLVAADHPTRQGHTVIMNG